MFNSYYKLKISGKYPNKFIKNLYKSGIYFEKIEQVNSSYYVLVNKDNYEKIRKIKTIYKIDLIERYGYLKVLYLIKNNYIFIISLVFSVFILFFLSNIIFNIKIYHSNESIRTFIKKELKHYGIDKYNFVLSYKEKELIKNKILDSNKDKIEWLEINRNGTTYEIRLEERIINKIDKDTTKNDIVAKKDGVITSINASSGEIVKKIGDYVKKGDVLISGSIYRKDELKNIVNAKGKVKAEVWYKVKVTLPIEYNEVIYTNNSKKNIKLSIIKNDLYLLKKYKNQIDKDILKTSNNLLPISFSIVNSKEVKKIFKKYDKDSSIKEAINLSIKKLNIKDNDILSYKVLKCIKSKDNFYIEIFFKINEDITDTSKIIELNKDNKKE